MISRPWSQGGLIAVCLFVLYGLGACRTIYVGDSGELVTAVYLLGIAHPSGYPLYLLLGKLWTLLVPAGSVAFRMSLFSAAWASSTCGLLFVLCRAMRIGFIASLFSALLLAFSPSFWSQANIQRIYSLNALFVVVATLLAWRWYEQRGRGALASVFFVCGLGAGNHLFMVVYALCVAVLVVRAEPSLIRRPRGYLSAAAAFLTGLLPYLYLPLRSRAEPPLDWGNPETFRAFLDVVFRRNFWQRAWLEKPADLLAIGGDYLRSLGTETAWAGAVLALVGVIAWRRRDRFVLLPLLAMASNAAVLAMHGSRPDLFIWHRYYIPSYVMTALLAGFGAQAVLGKTPRGIRWIPLLVPAVLLVTGWSTADRSRYRISEDFSRRVLAELPPGAHLIAMDDNILFTLLYLQFVEKMRPDVDLILQGVGGSQPLPLRFDPETDPLYFTHHPNWNMPALDIVPVGLVFRAWRAGRPLAPAGVEPPWLDSERDPAVPKDYLTRNLIGHFHYMLGVTAARHNWIRAREQFDLAAKAAPGNDVLFYNLGLIYRREGLLDEAIAAFGRSRRINPRHLASAGNPRAAEKLAELAAERARVRAIEARLKNAPSLVGIAEDSPVFHDRLAKLLQERGEESAARGHRLRALIARAWRPPVPEAPAPSREP